MNQFLCSKISEELLLNLFEDWLRLYWKFLARLSEMVTTVVSGIVYKHRKAVISTITVAKDFNHTAGASYLLSLLKMETKYGNLTVEMFAILYSTTPLESNTNGEDR